MNDDDLAVVVGAVGQPQLRGPDQPRREDELPGVAAAGRRLRARRVDGHRHHHRAARARTPTATTSSCATSGRPPRRSRRSSTRRSPSEMFSRDYADVFAGDERWQDLPTPEGDTFEWDADSTYVRKPPYFDGHAARAGAGHRHRRAPACCAMLGDSVTTDHISPAGSIKADSPAGQLPARARRRAARLQLLRLAARQPRGDDPRHVRQHPAAQPARARHRGRLHPRLHRRRRGRRRSTTRREHYADGRHAAGRARRQGVRLRARRATGRPRAPRCSACARSSPSPTSASTGRT